MATEPAASAPLWGIALDGGGTKTQALLVAPDGGAAWSAVRGPSNPNRVGAGRAEATALGALEEAMQEAARIGARIGLTLLCCAGDRAWWRGLGDRLGPGHGRVETVDDSAPALELAVGAGPGLALHAGTGSFVAARSLSGDIHYAGGLGWRLGDEGGGPALARRAVARALLSLQGWADAAPALTSAAEGHWGALGRAALTRAVYAAPDPEAALGAFAPKVLELAEEGDPAASACVEENLAPLTALAHAVAARLNLRPGINAACGAGGPLLLAPAARRALARLLPDWPVAPVEAAPGEGLRRLTARLLYLK